MIYGKGFKSEYIGNNLVKLLPSCATKGKKGCTSNSAPSKGAGKTLGKVPQPTSFPKPSSNTSVMTGLPRSTPNSGNNTQKGKGNGGNNSKPQSSPKPASNSNANNGQGNKTIKTGQSGNNWERTKQRYFGWLP